MAKKAVIILFFICFIVAGTVFMRNTWKISIRETKSKAIELALAAEAGFQKSFISKMNLDAGDINLEEYKEIKNSLTNVVKSCEGIRFAYIYVQRDGNIYFLADSEPSDSKDYSPPGQQYTEATAITFKPFIDGETLVTGPTTDRWGIWISVLVPMKDLVTGNVIAVFGIDYPAESWDDHAVVRTVQAGIVVFCVFLIIAAFYIAVRRNEALKAEKTKLAAMDEELRKSEVLFRTIFEQAPIGIAIGNNSHNILNLNPMFEKITGRSKEELTNLKWTDITHPDDLQLDQDSFSEFKSGEIDSYSIRKRYIKSDSSVVWVDMKIVSLDHGRKEDNNHLCIAQDITEYALSEQALHESERSKAVLLSHLPGMAYRCSYDRDWTMQFVSEGCFELTGYRPESLLYNKELSFNELICPEYREMLWHEWMRVLALKTAFRYEYEITAGSGERKWVLELGQGIYDETGKVEALEGIVIDITEQKVREAWIKYMNDHDFLTGLYNRRYFEEKKKELNKVDRLPLSIIIGNINGIRLINGAFGHAEGDRIIIEAAKIIQDCCRKGDILARTGGDEFRILLPNTNSSTAFEILEEILSTCEAYNKTSKNSTYDINISIGYSTKVADHESIEQVEKEAEDYLYNRKLLNRKSSHSSILSSIMAAMYERSQETEEHAVRLASLSKMIGARLNLSQKAMDELELFAMLHDIGKVGIDDRVLNKPGKLSDDEWEVMKKHPEIGYRIAASSSELEPIAEYILTHHERWGGGGYPKGLKGEEIPLLSRILALADAYDAMTEDRIYRKAMSREAALEEIKRNAGLQFDPYIAQIFVESL